MNPFRDSVHSGVLHHSLILVSREIRDGVDKLCFIPPSAFSPGTGPHPHPHLHLPHTTHHTTNRTTRSQRSRCTNEFNSHLTAKKWSPEVFAKPNDGPCLVVRLLIPCSDLMADRGATCQLAISRSPPGFRSESQESSQRLPLFARALSQLQHPIVTVAVFSSSEDDQAYPTYGDQCASANGSRPRTPSHHSMRRRFLASVCPHAQVLTTSSGLELLANSDYQFAPMQGTALDLH